MYEHSGNLFAEDEFLVVRVHRKRGARLVHLCAVDIDELVSGTSNTEQPNLLIRSEEPLTGWLQKSGSTMTHETHPQKNILQIVASLAKRRAERQSDDLARIPIRMSKPNGGTIGVQSSNGMTDEGDRRHRLQLLLMSLEMLGDLDELLIIDTTFMNDVPQQITLEAGFVKALGQWPHDRSRVQIPWDKERQRAIGHISLSLLTLEGRWL